MRVASQLIDLIGETMRIGIDLDGVCYDFTGAFCRYVDKDPATVTRWHFYEDWGHTAEWFLSESRDAIRSKQLFLHGDLIPGTKEAFDVLIAMGHTIHLVTDRCSLDPEDTGRIIDSTKQWLYDNRLRYSSIHFTGDKDTIVKEQELDVFLDDRIENYDMVDPHVRFNYLFDQAWNRTFEISRHPRSRVDGWPAFVEAVRFKTAAEHIAQVNEGWKTKDSGEREHFASGMQRDTEKGKLRYDLIPRFMLNRVAGLYTRGAEKYSDNNWMQACGEEELRRFRSSANRHFEQWFQGDTDEDHAAATFFNMAGAEYTKAVMEGRQP